MHDPTAPSFNGPRLTRRQVIQTGLAAAAAAPLLGPRITYGQQANETLNLAAVGVGNRGKEDLMHSAKGKNVRLVALCDVDAKFLAQAKPGFEDAATYNDYRVMLDEMDKDIDAVLISTPDHMHGPIAIAAMQRGLHVHVQKPLAHNIAELRTMMRLAETNKLVTQMGTQRHSHEAYRTATAMIRAGAIGKVKEAHLWVSKSWGAATQGRPDRTDPVPAHLDWDNWLAVAPPRPFVNGIYHPAQWRGWIDFGSGTLGDMGCHIFDPVFSCLDLATPLSVVSHGPQHHAETFALDSDIRYQFAGTRYTADELTLRWTDGSRGSRPDVAKAQLPPGVGLPGEGLFLIGEEGVMVLPHCAMPRFYKEGAVLRVDMNALEGQDHYTQFTDACRGVGETSTPFSYSGRVTEAVLLGTIAGRFKDRHLEWDAKAMRFDHAPANELVYRTYAQGRRPEGLI